MPPSCCTHNYTESSVESLLLQPLDNTLIFIITACITLPYLYYYFIAAHRPMQHKHIQTYVQLISYTILFMYGCYCMYNQKMTDIWLRPTDMYTYPCFHPSSMSYRSTRLLFELEISWYISSLICVLCSKKQSDFNAMLLHHCITPVEIYYSWYCGQHSAGLAVMVLHDCSDIALHLAKLLKYYKFHRITDMSFIIFMCTFFITRLVLLPITALSGSQWFYPHHSHDSCSTALVNGLWLFVCLHCYWFTLIVKIAVHALKHGSVEKDIRDEGDNSNRNIQPSIKYANTKQVNGHTNKLNGHNKQN